MRMPKIPQIKQNRKYWESRKELERAYIKQRLADDEKFNAELQKRFDRVQEEMQRNIELELYRLSDKNGINIAKVKEAVSQADIKQMESYAKRVVEKAQKLRKELGRSLSQDDFSKEVNDRMRLYNATMRINRLEMIKSRIGMQTVELGLDVNADILRKLNQDYQDQIERQAGIMGDAVPNLTNQELKNAVKSVIATTGGVSFSKRVWGDMDGLKAELDVQLVNSLVQGQSASVIAKNLLPFVSEKFQNKRYAAERIARTESARVDTDATLASLKKYGYKYCQWHDETKACDTCMAIARSNPTGYGQGVYEVDDVPYLPAHPNCRCSISAYWVDEKNNLYEKPNYNEQSEESGRVEKVQENNTAKLNRLFNSLNIKTAKADDIIELGNVFNKEYNIQDNLGNKSYISNVLSKYRDVGEDIPEKSWAKGSNSQIKNDLKQAFSHYPKEWSEYLDNEYMLAGKAEDRGFYVRWYVTPNGNTKTPTWLVRGNRLREGVTMDQYNKFGEDLHNGKYNSIYSTGRRETTAWHEIGHFVEEHNKDTLRISKEFVANRTKGEQPEMLRDILKNVRYRESEVTLKDNFISPYIGKVYDDATEVLSMGLESIFEPVKMGQLKYVDNNGQIHRAKIEDDEEYLNLILGILLKG